ncbi:hypothetical protein VKT23_016563 [Stygiomarasmius scandens]|uniref:Retrotransposon gag domain-containing protein n=1 Tax=Marasmiellus scandens TaxID=2682957 RepID=A0ABR1IYV4_9AGAR
MIFIFAELIQEAKEAKEVKAVVVEEEVVMTHLVVAAEVEGIQAEVAEAAEDTIQQTEEEAAEDTIQQTEEEAAEDKIQQTEEEAAEDTIQQTEEEAAEDTIQQTEEEAAEDTIQQTEEEAAEDTIQQTEEEAAEDTIQQTEEEAAEDTIQQTEEEAAEDTIQQTEEEAAEDTIQQTEEEAAEDTIQQTEEEAVMADPLEEEAHLVVVVVAAEVTNLTMTDPNETAPEPEEKSRMPGNHQTSMVINPTYATSFNTKEEYNRWLLSYFVSGAAAKFAAAAEKQNWIKDLTTDQMWDKLDERFTDGKLPKKAAEALEVTRQGKTGIQEFLAWFEEKCGEAGYDWHEPDEEGNYAGEDPTHIRLLDKSLRTKIVDAIHMAEVVPVNYIPYHNKALRIGINIENHEEDGKGGNQLRWIDGKIIGGKGNSGSSGSSGSGTMSTTSRTTTTTTVGGPGVLAPAYSAGSGQGAAMQIDRTTARTRGLCYKCGQKWGEGKDCDQCKRRGMKVRSQTEESDKPGSRPVEDKTVDKGKG